MGVWERGKKKEGQRWPKIKVSEEGRGDGERRGGGKVLGRGVGGEGFGEGKKGRNGEGM